MTHLEKGRKILLSAVSLHSAMQFITNCQTMTLPCDSINVAQFSMKCRTIAEKFVLILSIFKWKMPLKPFVVFGISKLTCCFNAGALKSWDCWKDFDGQRNTNGHFPQRFPFRGAERKIERVDVNNDGCINRCADEKNKSPERKNCYQLQVLLPHEPRMSIW